MSTTTAPGADLEETVGTVSSGWSRWRMVLLVWLGATVAATLLLGSRATGLAELQRGVATGEITAVTVVGTSAEDVDQAVHLVLRWDGPWTTRHTDVMVVGPAGTVGEPARTEPPWTTSVGPGYLEQLARSSPDGLDLSYEPGRSSAFSMHRYEMPEWFAFPALAWAVGAFVSLVGGPQPRLGTRWAWGWTVVALGVPALVAYLVLGLRRPRADGATPPGRRMTGGWTFLLLLVLGAFQP